MGSGGKGGGGAKAYDYFGTLAGAVCWGPVDVLHAVLVDGKEIVTGPITLTDDATNLSLSAGNEKYLDSGGRLTLYRGTGTQSADAALDGHPPYRGICYLVAVHLLFGRERTMAPNVQVIVSRKPVCDTSLVADEDNVLTADGQCNPVAAIAELVTGANGLALPVSMLDGASWLAAGAWAADASRLTRTHCSPIFTSQSDARRALQSLLEMVDATLYWTPAGKLAIALLEPGTEPGGVATLDARHITERHRLDAPGWPDVPSTTLVRYRDRAAQYKDRQSQVVNLLALRQRGGIPAVANVQRPHVTSADQANAIAAELARRSGRPIGEISLTVRRPFAADLYPGAKVKVDVDPEPGGTGLAQLCVVQEIRAGAEGDARLRLRPDTLVPATPYSPAWSTPEPQSVGCPPIDSSKALALPLPPHLWPADVPAVAVLATRPRADVIGFRVFFGTATDGDFADLGTQPGFAVRAAIKSGVTVAPDDDEIALTLPDSDTGPDAYLAGRYPGTEIGADTDALLLVLARVDANGRVTVTDDKLDYEICSIVTRAVVGSDTIYTVARGRHGTLPREWLDTDRAWIVPRESIVAWSHVRMSALVTDDAPGYLRLVAYTVGAEDTTTPIPEVSFVLPESFNPYPYVVWSSPSGSQGVTDSNGDFTVAFTVRDGSGDLVRIERAVRNLATGDLVEFSPIALSGAREHSVTTPVNVSAGNYEFIVTATDRLGHVTTDRRNLFREGGGALKPPTFDPPSGTFVQGLNGWIKVTISADAPADRLEVCHNYPGSSGAVNSWPILIWPVTGTTYEAVVSVAQRIWARAGDGANWSEWVSADYHHVRVVWPNDGRAL